MLVKEFLFHSTCHCHCQVRNGNLLKSRVSEIHVNRISINRGVGVYCQLGGFFGSVRSQSGMHLFRGLLGRVTCGSGCYVCQGVRWGVQCSD